MGDVDTEKVLTKILDNEEFKYCYKDNLIIRGLQYKNKGALVIINPNQEKIKQKISFETKINPDSVN